MGVGLVLVVGFTVLSAIVIIFVGVGLDRAFNNSVRRLCIRGCFVIFLSRWSFLFVGCEHVRMLVGAIRWKRRRVLNALTGSTVRELMSCPDCSTGKEAGLVDQYVPKLSGIGRRDRSEQLLEDVGK